MKPILLILTGGTICSFGDENNVNRDVNIGKAGRLIIENFRKSESSYRDEDFEERQILDTLSENMTVSRWNELIAFLKTIDFSSYKGVIMAHGTDTLAYTAGLMALVMSKEEAPMLLVSSSLPLDTKGANGNDNFRAAVELICEGIPAGVYVPYKNSDGNMYIHKACNLKQCDDYCDDFFSSDMAKLGKGIAGIREYTEGLRGIKKEEKGGGIELKTVGSLKEDVIFIQPYVGLNYDFININEQVRAVVHGTYHSCTACADKGRTREGHKRASILRLLDICRPLNIPVIACPCMEEDSAYVSSADMLKAGVSPVYGITPEFAYVKALLSGALGYKGEAVADFVRKNI